MGAMGSFGSDRSDSEAADMSKVFNSPVLGVAGLKEENPGSEQNTEVKSYKKGSGILIAIIAVGILLILAIILLWTHQNRARNRKSRRYSDFDRDFGDDDYEEDDEEEEEDEKDEEDEEDEEDEW